MSAGKPIAGITRFTGTMDDEFLLVIQIGASTGDPGKAEMRSLTLHELREYVRAGFGNAMRFRGSVTALPDSPEINDYFHAQTTFVSGSKTYTEAHLYEYSADGSWTDISDVFSDYVRRESFEELRERVSATEVDIDTAQEDIVGLKGDVEELEGYMSSGLHYKGECTYANLPGSGNTAGDQWFVTDKGCSYVWNGSSWDAIKDLGLVWVTNADGDDELCMEI